jgi:hypothetical protein
MFWPVGKRRRGEIIFRPMNDGTAQTEPMSEKAPQATFSH